jgi:dolichol-phosphate mannosyltransferase
MSASARKLSVVCPAYEEVEVLPRFHAELTAVLDTLGSEFEVEILYVDDGSTDGTLDIIRNLADRDRRVHYLSLSRNFGHQAAMTAGMEHATGDVVVTLDSDLQHPPSVILLLLEKWRQGNDVVMTLREPDPDLSWPKRVTSWAFFHVMRRLSETEMRVAASDYRLLSRRALDCLLRFHETHRYLRGMVHWLGFPKATVRFQVARRGGGRSKFTFSKLFLFAADALLSFSKLPLRLSAVVGALYFFAGCGYAGYLVVAAFCGGTAAGWGIVLAALLITAGCVMTSLGVVGEYVGRIYEQVKGRPLYLVKEAWPERAAPSGAIDASRDRPPGRAAA